MPKNIENSEPVVDAVITWVNGNDPKWQKKINRYSKTKIDFGEERYKRRYNSIGEIDIAIKGIIKFAPFIRKIHLVTDAQKPENFESLQILAKKKQMQLQMVDHQSIFRGFEELLPTFNSCSIGTALFRIPDLSEHFVIFNDDTFLMRSSSVTDFFIDQKPVIRGKWEQFRENRSLRKLYRSLKSKEYRERKDQKISFKKFQQNSAKLAGADRYLRRFHTPVCVRKSTLENFFSNNDLFKHNLQYRFRDKDQFIISSLSEHLEIKNGTYNYRPSTQLTYFRNYKNLLVTKLKLKWFELNKNKLFVTFQSLDMADQDSLNYILRWIDEKLS